MRISFKCGACGETGKAPETFAGKVIACPSCGKGVQLPPEGPPAVAALPVSDVRVVDVYIPLDSMVALVMRFILATIIVAAGIGLVLLLIGAVLGIFMNLVS